MIASRTLDIHDEGKFILNLARLQPMLLGEFAHRHFLSAKCRRTISAFLSTINFLFSLLMENTSNRVKANPTSDKFQFQGERDKTTEREGNHFENMGAGILFAMHR